MGDAKLSHEKSGWYRTMRDVSSQFLVVSVLLHDEMAPCRIDGWALEDMSAALHDEMG